MRPTVAEAEANGPVFWKISNRIESPIQDLPFREIFGLEPVEICRQGLVRLNGLIMGLFWQKMTWGVVGNQNTNQGENQSPPVFPGGPNGSRFGWSRRDQSQVMDFTRYTAWFPKAPLLIAPKKTQDHLKRLLSSKIR